MLKTCTYMNAVSLKLCHNKISLHHMEEVDLNFSWISCFFDNQVH